MRYPLPPFRPRTQGDVRGERPGAFSMVARAKWDAWEKLAGMEQATARDEYVALAAATFDGDGARVGDCTARAVEQR